MNLLPQPTGQQAKRKKENVWFIKVERFQSSSEWRPQCNTLLRAHASEDTIFKHMVALPSRPSTISVQNRVIDAARNGAVWLEIECLENKRINFCPLAQKFLIKIYFDEFDEFSILSIAKNRKR
jgi:hypothetical protein